MVYVRFFLDKKEPKNQERKKLPPTRPTPARLSFRPRAKSCVGEFMMSEVEVPFFQALAPSEETKLSS